MPINQILLTTIKMLYIMLIMIVVVVVIKILSSFKEAKKEIEDQSGTIIITRLIITRLQRAEEEEGPRQTPGEHHLYGGGHSCYYASKP